MFAFVIAQSSQRNEPPQNPGRFREGWEEKWEAPGPLPTPEVIEGDGGHTDWDTWTEAVKVEENAFAETMPQEESAVEPIPSNLENAFAPTEPMPLGPK
ncbi:MAG TPA: hypothetical protein PLG21_22460 [Anaerolineae bacterium]|nr:hypothetical protein [Anaerolineae bacterium]